MVIVCILGKSGCGKSTLEKQLSDIGYSRIVSYTTRDIRDGEENHREYHFVTDEQFESLLKNGRLVESAEYNGKKYGAPRPMGSEKNVIVVEADGFMSFKRLYGDQVIGIYINVNEENITARLKGRGNMTESEIQERKAEDERKFSNIESVVDAVIDGNGSKAEILNNALKAINRSKRK